MKYINNRQIKALRTAASKVFASDDDYRDFLASNFDGITSTKDLSQDEASKAIDILCKMTGFRHPVKSSGEKGRPAGHLTEKQLRKIYALQEFGGWSRHSLTGFIKRQTGKFCPVEMLLNHEAQKVIIGMQRVISKGDSDEFKRLNKM